MDTNTLKTALADLPLGSVRYLDRTGSTNDDAAAWAEEGAPDLGLIVADEQTSGRGRLGRSWFTPPGTALAFSLVLRPHQRDLQFLPRFSALGALAVHSSLRDEYNLHAEIKWPNDVLIQQQKVAGVLAEIRWLGNTITAIILGIGVNVTAKAAPPAVFLNYPAISIEQISHQKVDRLDLLRVILSNLIIWRTLVSQPEFITAWEARLAFRDEWVRLSEAGKIIEGKILGLNQDGSLKLLNRANDLIAIYSGDISLRPIHTR